MKLSSESNPQKTDEIRKIGRYAVITALIWTALMSGLFISDYSDNDETVHTIGRSIAQASYEKDLLFRRWAARHGGVYVPETDATPANPHLAGIPERDIVTPSGRRLTLVNPAYMSRQIFELADKMPDIPHGHITSLNPIRPENSPDQWETRALKALEQGAKEVVEEVQLNGAPHLRFMRSLITEKPCLRCHSAQGYKEGDGRGGISVTLPLAPIIKTMQFEAINDIWIYSFILLTGLGIIWFGKRKIVRIVTLLQDERNKLLESEKRRRELFAGAGDGIFIMSVDGKLLEVNESFARMHGYSVQEMEQMNLQDMDTPETFSLMPERMKRLLNEKNLTFEVEHYHKDGHIFALEVSSSLVHSGGESYIQCFHRDITERKQAEEERLLLERQFHHSQKLESLGVLAGGIAHDFNNILTVIIGHCYMAREDMNSEQELKASFQQVENAANRAAVLCRQMLAYAGRTESEKSVLSLWMLVDEVVKMLQATIKKNIVMDIDLKRDVPVIVGDTGQIQQIVMNLIINAAEAIGDENGAIGVSLSTMVIEADGVEKDTFGTIINAGRYTCLEVSDTGHGMDEETQKRIFEPFFTTKFTGRGLGMSAICGIVKSHNGALQLRSTPGVGTTFKVWFPLPETSSEYSPIHPETVTPYLETGGAILLVDDEETLLDMGTVLLEAMGFTAMTAQHGSEALEIYRERGNEIDLILLDLIMPVMGGIETYHELRKISPTVPIIICSGYGVESVEDVITYDPYAGFVHKPYKPDELRDVLMRMMKGEG